MTEIQFVCPSCSLRLRAAMPPAVLWTCGGCAAVYPVHFGIVDLRPTRLRLADADFDREADLREASALHDELALTTHRDWLLSDRAIASETEPRLRRFAECYSRQERETYGRHGEAILEKLDTYLVVQERERGRRWNDEAHVALEAGCGTGQYPIGFARRFETVLVTDISYVALVQAAKIAADNGLRNVTIFASDLARLPLPDGSVDFLHCNGVIEHVAAPAEVVREVARVTSSHGITLILSPNRHSLWLEPHFQIPAFGLWPVPIRLWLVRRARGVTSFAGTRLLSLRELRHQMREAFPHYRIYMLPPGLRTTARGGAVRLMVRTLLSLPVLGRVMDLLLNRVLLAVAPYHTALGFKE